MDSNYTSVFYLDTLPYLHKGRAAALGFFDGIHAGHKKLIRYTVRTAATQGLTSTVLTFVNFNKGGEGLLTSIEEKRAILSSMGVDELLVLDFESVKDMPASVFLSEIIGMKMNARVLISGEDYRFGKGAQGDCVLLREYAEKNGIGVKIFEDQLYGEEKRRLSSTWLREALSRGDVRLYGELCSGTLFSYSGIVVRGKMLGRKLGFPTVNISIPEDKFKVRYGVYASRVILGGRTLYGVTNVGLRPTVEESDTAVAETYLFDTDEDLYGARIKVELLEFIRPEKKFEDLTALSGQVSQDKISAAKFFAQSGTIVGNSEVNV